MSLSLSQLPHELPRDKSAVSVKFNFRARAAVISRDAGELERYGAFDVRTRMFVTNHDSCTWTAAVAEPGNVFNVDGAFTVQPLEQDSRNAYLRHRHVTDMVKFHFWVPAPPVSQKFADSPLTHAAESISSDESPVAPIRHTRELMFVAAGFAPLKDVLAAACGVRNGDVAIDIIQPPTGCTISVSNNFQSTGVILHIDTYDKGSPQFAAAQRNYLEYVKLQDAGLIARCPLNDSDAFNQDFVKLAQTLSKSISSTMHLNHEDGDDVLSGQITLLPMDGQVTLFTGINRSIRMSRHRSEPEKLVLLHVVHAMNVTDVACGITMRRDLDANTVSMVSASPELLGANIAGSAEDEFKHIKDSIFAARGNEEKYDKRGLPWIPMQDHFTATVLTVFTMCPRASPYVSDRTFAGARQPETREMLIISKRAQQIGALARARNGVSLQQNLQATGGTRRKNRQTTNSKKLQSSITEPGAAASVAECVDAAPPPTKAVFDSSSLYNLSVDLETLAEEESSFMIPIAAGTEHIEGGQCHPHQLAQGFMHLGDCEDKARKIQQIKMGIINLGEKIEAFAGPGSGGNVNGKLGVPLMAGAGQRLMSGLRLDRLQEYARQHVLSSPLFDLTMAQAVNVLQTVHMMAFRFKNSEYDVNGMFGIANGASADKTTTQIGGHAWASMESSYAKPKTSHLVLEGTAFVAQQADRVSKTLHGVVKMVDIPFEKRQFFLAHGWRKVLGPGLSSPTEDVDPNGPLFKEINAEQFEQFMMTLDAFNPFLKTPTIPEDPSGMSAAANPRMRQCIPYFPHTHTHTPSSTAASAQEGTAQVSDDKGSVPAKSFYGKAFVKGEKLIATLESDSVPEMMCDPANPTCCGGSATASRLSFGVWYDDIGVAHTRNIKVGGKPFSEDHVEKMFAWHDDRDEVINGPRVDEAEVENLLAQAFGKARLTNSGSTVPVEESINIIVSEAADNMQQRRYMRNVANSICERENATYKTAGKQHVFKTFEAYNSVVRVLVAKVADLQSNISVEAADLQL